MRLRLICKLFGHRFDLVHTVPPEFRSQFLSVARCGCKAERFTYRTGNVRVVEPGQPLVEAYGDWLSRQPQWIKDKAP